MPIDWNDNKKRRAFREALQAVYPSPSELEIFVDEGLNENISVIAGRENLQVTAHSLLKWARAKSRLDEVYKIFKEENPNHPDINTLERQDLISQKSNLAREDWDELFGYFFIDDLADLKRAFGHGFETALGIKFQRARPNYSAIADLEQIRELLELYDADEKGSVLAVRFVECAIAQIQRSSEGTNRDLTPLEQWRDRIAQRFEVALDKPAPVQDAAFHAYLLVALEVLAGSEVIVYPELHIVGQDAPIPFGADKARCQIDQVIEPIAKWIQQAENTLDANNYEFDEIVVEVFLPCRYLEDDIATDWKVRNERDDEIDFGNHRRFLVRSLDRVRNRTARRLLKHRWKTLEDCVKAGTVCSKFHLQTCCPSRKGDLSAALKDSNAPGLKFVAPLPTDTSQRTDLLYDMIDSAVPIALWMSEMPDVDIKTLCTEFDELLTGSITNFTALATQWRTRRRESSLSTSIRLLCDRPDRFPNLPDPEQEDDLLVAS